jgi:DNA-binding transcriptional LysR family regulator
MPQLAGFLDAHPNLRIEFHVTQDTRAIQSENIDVLLHVGEPRPSRLIARKLGQGRPAAYASPAYIARHGELKDPNDLRAHRCLAFKPDWLAQPFVKWTFSLIVSKQLVRLFPDWTCKPSFNIYALYRGKSAKTPRVASLLAFVQRSFRDFDRDEHTILHAGSFSPQPNSRGLFHDSTARKVS